MDMTGEYTAVAGGKLRLCSGSRCGDERRIYLADQDGAGDGAAAEGDEGGVISAKYALRRLWAQAGELAGCATSPNGFQSQIPAPAQ